MEGVLEKCEVSGDVISLTGDDGIQFKVWVMHAFANDISDNDGSGSEEGNGPSLPLLRIMPATKAADCGVSSNLCRRSYRNGMPPSMYSVVQERGRVDRNPLAELGDNRYEIHISFGCVVKMYARIMQHPLKSERSIQLKSMREALVFLVTPEECQHVLMEKYFEDHSATREYEPCKTMCTKCNENTNPLTGRVNRTRLANLVVGFCSGKKHPWNDLVKFVKSRSDDIFPMDGKLKYVGPIHALCMQMVSSQIIHLKISDDKKYLIGRPELSPTSVVIQLAMSNGEPCALSESYGGAIRQIDNC